MRLFEYMRKENFNQLSPEQQRFMAKLITKEVEQIADEIEIIGNTGELHFKAAE